MDTDTIVNVAVATILWTLGSWVVLFVIMYFISPFFTKYGDQRSRVLYSAVYTLAFAIIIGIALGGIITGLTVTYGTIPTLAVAFVIVLILTLLQNYAMTELFRRGLLKIKRK